MTRIRVLPDSVANKIAAGEVVERPASVVKELVENALDAGANEISVEVRKGGIALVRVRDNGCGMGRDDALLSLERHSTSKIAAAADLFSIRTMGFRGEALPSIAAVCRMEITTRERGAHAGTRLAVEGGAIADTRAAGAPEGTEVAVRDLFFNTPVRRKFLKSERTEVAQVAATVIHEALPKPAVGFMLVSDGEELVMAPAVNDRLSRISSLFGADLAKILVGCKSANGPVSLEAFVSPPELTRGNRTDQHFFVNGRPVQDRALSFAVANAYEGIIPARRYPVIFLFLEIEPSEVDVNVHPTKREVRFRNSALVREVIRETLVSAIGGSGQPRDASRATGVQPPRYETREDRGVFERVPFVPLVQEPLPYEGGRALPGDERGRLRPLGQIKNLYVLCEDEDGIAIIDQHAAHERVLFERVMAFHETGKGELQRLLIPVTVSLTASQSVFLAEKMEIFRSLGLGLEPFGAHAVKIDHLPACLGDVNPERLLRDTLGELAEEGRASAVKERLAELVARKVCHAAVKRRDALPPEQLQRLVDDLMRCQTPHTCPHGRPTIIRMSSDELAKKFGRA